MPYYDTFMNVNKHPAQRWRNQLQDTVDKVFENASTWWDDVWEEKEFGSDALETITTNEEKRTAPDSPLQHVAFRLRNGGSRCFLFRREPLLREQPFLPGTDPGFLGRTNP